ncbi:MAG: metallophosphoesterase family protein [Anaerolineae bacterium]
MKLAILSDIHGNLPALRATAEHAAAWQPDYIIINGDIVNRGPCSPACWQFIQQRQAADGWLVTQGNHETYVTKHAQPAAGANGREFEINQLSYWTYQQLNGQVAALDALPKRISLPTPDGREIRICHASMRGNRDGILPHSSAEEVRRQIAPAPALFATAHIHFPFIRQVDDTLIVNSGSAGSLCYGDTRASYAQVTWRQGRWHAEIAYVPYDMTETERDFQSSGFLEEAGAVAHIIYHEWRTARPLIYEWVQQYQGRVLAGEIGLDTAVSHYLAQKGLRRP